MGFESDLLKNKYKSKKYKTDKEVEEFFAQMTKKDKYAAEIMKMSRKISRICERVREIEEILKGISIITASDNTVDFYDGYVKRHSVIDCDHSWVLKHTNTGYSTWQCTKCGLWDTRNI